MLRARSVKKFWRHRASEFGIEFEDGSRLFVDSKDYGLELKHHLKKKPNFASQPPWSRRSWTRTSRWHKNVDATGLAPRQRQAQAWLLFGCAVKSVGPHNRLRVFSVS